MPRTICWGNRGLHECQHYRVRGTCTVGATSFGKYTLMSNLCIQQLFLPRGKYLSPLSFQYFMASDWRPGSCPVNVNLEKWSSLGTWTLVLCSLHKAHWVQFQLIWSLWELGEFYISHTTNTKYWAIIERTDTNFSLKKKRKMGKKPTTKELFSKATLKSGQRYVILDFLIVI